MTNTLDDLATWRADREVTLRQPHGWLSLTGLHWLDGEARAYADLPGTWRADGDAVEYAGGGVEIGGRPIDGSARVTPVDGEPGVLVTVGERRVEVVRREHHFALRIRDPQAGTRRRFAGVPTFPVDAAWVVTGRFTPWDEPRRIDVDTVVDGLGFHPTAVGTVTLGLGDTDGGEHELVALADTDGVLKLHFRDATSGATTYGGGRILRTEVPADDGSVVIDFNRTVNLPCAFTAYATCPLPPAGNTLPVAVEVGEKTPV